MIVSKKDSKIVTFSNFNKPDKPNPPHFLNNNVLLTDHFLSCWDIKCNNPRAQAPWTGKTWRTRFGVLLDLVRLLVLTHTANKDIFSSFILTPFPMTESPCAIDSLVQTSWPLMFMVFAGWQTAVCYGPQDIPYLLCQGMFLFGQKQPWIYVMIWI